MKLERAVNLYQNMFMGREIDKRERLLVTQDRAHFHVSGRGHEASAALADYLISSDYLHLHYRDKSLLLARGLSIAEFFNSVLCRETSHSSGRQMSAHFAAPHLRVLSMVGPVGNNALQAVGVAAAIRNNPEQPLVICSVGDGTTQQGEFYEAVAEAVRDALPVLFLVHDNRYSISTSTCGRTFFDLPTGSGHEFFGLPVKHVNGRDPIAADVAFAEIIPQIRRDRRPTILILHVERLCDHTNADDQSRYRPAHELPEALANADPVLSLEAWLADRMNLSALHAEIQTQVEAALAQAIAARSPVAQFNAKASLPPAYLDRREYCGAPASQPRLTMQQAINAVLRNRLEQDPRVLLYGQDIEDPKGDVFGVTRGLSRRYPGRVLNAPLSESTILGTCIGRALAGQRPVAFIQFADFLPLAFNQIVSELGSMQWRTCGGWQCPVIVMVACGGYRPGLGPFHAQTLESVMAHTPGLDVVMPSSAGDAAGLLTFHMLPPALR